MSATHGSSPLTRGKPHRKPRNTLRGGAHPRSRGENDDSDDGFSSHCGSSPLTRGKHGLRRPLVRLERLIPAHAGKTLTPAGIFVIQGAHPRSRGENLISAFRSAGPCGSSPLTRGKPEGERDRVFGVRLIPAHAGKTRRPCSAPAAGAAHPRSRGENTGWLRLTAILKGSSPLTRGKHRNRSAWHDRSRLIPAHAGKTCRARGQRRPRTAHPRSRGENLRPTSASATSCGSSPLTRGKPDRECHCRGGGRLIPAHAGKTMSRQGISQRTLAHPRSRGENTS